jgi:membrane-associated phospholipid phosphatase
MAPCPGKEKAVSSGTFVYKPRVDIPLTAATVGWTLYAFSQVYSKPNSTAAQIEQLNKNNLAWFDRWAAGMSSKDADSKSNLLFYGGLSFPFFLLADRKVRADAPKVGLLYLETMAITGFLYTSATYWDDRYRPETYDQSIPVADRQGGNYKNAFFAGHVAQVASFSFFTAKIYDTYHPHSPWKWAFYGGAALTTGTTIYLRHRAGKHFPSDILLGTAVGTLSGILVPQLHKRKNAAGQGWQLSPETRFGTTGLCATYHIR